MEFLRGSIHKQAISRAEIERAEAYFKTPFPAGYVQCMTEYGEGMYCGFFRFWRPDRLPEENRDYQHRWSDRWWPFWNSNDILTPEQGNECISIGGSIDGDEILFRPSQPDRVFVFPRHDHTISIIRPDFSDLWEWDQEEPLFRCYEPFRYDVQRYIDSARTDLVIGELFDKFCARWPEAAQHVAYRGYDDEDEEEFCAFFIPSIGTHIGLNQAARKQGKVHLRLWHDAEFTGELDAFFLTLNEPNWPGIHP